MFFVLQVWRCCCATLSATLGSWLKDTGCSEMGHLELGVVLDAGDSDRQTVLTGLENVLSRYA